MQKEIKDFHTNYMYLKQETLGDLSSQCASIERKVMQQSRLFMIDIIPHIHRLFYEVSAGTIIKVLDVGIHNGGGTALLAELHNRQSYNHLKMDVTGLDINDHFKNYIQLCNPSFKYVTKDIFDIPDSEKWDLVLCSHVIEHLKEPFIFVEKLKKLTKKYLIVACPYNEQKLRKGHVNTIDSAFIAKLNPIEHYIYTNFCWRINGQCLIMIFKGTS